MSEPGRAESLLAAEMIARIAVAAGTLKLRPQPLLDALHRFDARAFADVFVGVDHTFSWLGVQCVCPRGKARPTVVDYLSELHAARARQRGAVLARHARSEFVELRLAGDGSVAGTVHSVGRAPMDADLELVQQIAELSADSAMLLSALAADLARVGETQGISDSEHGVTTIRFVLANATAQGMGRTLGVMDAVAAGLGATDPQRELLRSSHQSLSQGRPCIVAIQMQNQRVTMGLGVEYAPLSWDNTLRLMQGLHPSAGAGKQLGLISGACGSDHASLVRIELGPAEPPGVQAWSALRQGP